MRRGGLSVHSDDTRDSGGKEERLERAAEVQNGVAACGAEVDVEGA